MNNDSNKFFFNALILPRKKFILEIQHIFESVRKLFTQTYFVYFYKLHATLPTANCQFDIFQLDNTHTTILTYTHTSSRKFSSHLFIDISIGHRLFEIFARHLSFFCTYSKAVHFHRITTWKL